MQKKGKFPSQTLPNPRGVHEVSYSSEPNPRMDEVKAIITLRSGKELKQPVTKPTEEGQEVKEAEPEEVVTKETTVKNSTPPPFPQALKAKKNAINQVEILEVLRQVKVNIPLLDMIKQVPTYAKILKDLCTVKRGLNVDKKAFLTEQVSAIIQCKTPVKYKDPGCPTISVNIGGTCVEKALLDLGASVNLLHIVSCR